MGLTKHKGFKQDINDIANIFKALGHPARIQIMNFLLSTESSTCGQLVNVLPLAQSTVSKHLLELKKCELINISFSGKNSIYSVEKSKFNIINQFINNYIEIYNTNPNNAADKQVESKKKLKEVKVEKIITKKYIHLKKLNYEFKSKKTTID